MFLSIYFSMNRLRRPEVKKIICLATLFALLYSTVVTCSWKSQVQQMQQPCCKQNTRPVTMFVKLRKKIYHKYSSSNIFKDIDVKLFEQCQFFIFLLFVLYHTWYFHKCKLFFMVELRNYKSATCEIFITI